jgi:hypothetical protein
MKMCRIASDLCVNMTIWTITLHEFGYGFIGASGPKYLKYLSQQKKKPYKIVEKNESQTLCQIYFLPYLWNQKYTTCTFLYISELVFNNQ